MGDGLSSDIQGGVNAGLDTCWYNPSHAENPGKVVPTYEIADLKELYPLIGSALVAAVLQAHIGQLFLLHHQRVQLVQVGDLVGRGV